MMWSLERFLWMIRVSRLWIEPVPLQITIFQLPRQELVLAGNDAALSDSDQPS